MSRDVPPPSSEDAATRMRATRQTDTAAEMKVRRELHRRGLRYRVDYPIRGVTRARPDVVFSKLKIAVFVDGCFWHSCPEHATTPKVNRGWWVEKLAANVERDERHNRELTEAGWVVFRFWEHEEPADVVDRIEAAVREQRQQINRRRR
jgi:DNA mismatch endonuclease (patch repair protein)